MEYKHSTASIVRPESSYSALPKHLLEDDDDHQLVMVTPRQLEIIQLVAEGATDRQIADTLSVSPRTVSNTLHRIYDRLGTSSRARLASLHARGRVKARPNGHAQRPTATRRHAH